MENTKEKKQVSKTMLLLVVSMLCFGLVLLFSSSITNSFVFKDTTTHFITRQVIYTVLGLLVMFFVTKIDIRKLAKKRVVHLLLIISYILLILVLIPGIGIVSGGARRWLPLGFTNFQPSELTKIILIFYLSWYYSRLRRIRLLKKNIEMQKNNNSGMREEDFIDEDEERFFKQGISWQEAFLQARMEIIRPMMVVISTVTLIMMQAHVSASIIIVLVSLFIMASAHLHWRSWLIGFSLGVVALTLLLAVVIILTSLFPNTNFTQRWTHVGRRLTSFVNKEASSEDDNRQIEQALIATGSGGLFGRGLGQSRQKYLYLSENHNDYIYSVASEELGFVGGTTIILLFGAFLFVGMKIASTTSSMFTQLVAAGCTYLIVIQGLFSIGVNLNLLPATGISLPLFSYGGTSNIFFLISVGIILSVSKYGRAADTFANTYFIDS